MDVYLTRTKNIIVVTPSLTTHLLLHQPPTATSSNEHMIMPHLPSRLQRHNLPDRCLASTLHLSSSNSRVRMLSIGAPHQEPMQVQVTPANNATTSPATRLLPECPRRLGNISSSSSSPRHRTHRHTRGRPQPRHTITSARLAQPAPARLLHGRLRASKRVQVHAPARTLPLPLRHLRARRRPRDAIRTCLRSIDC
jgi:hypothetical protein